MCASLPLFDSPEISAAVVSTRRHFYRCEFCLSVVATETALPNVDNYAHSCGACNGPVEYMGVTDGAGRLARVVGYRAPCDDRCTNARGPNCECSCGGANHGSGVVVPIVEYNGVPRLGLQDPKAKARGEYFESLCARFLVAWSECFGAYARAKSRGDYLDPAAFRQYLAGCKIHDRFRAARHLRVYSTRTKTIEKLITEVS